MNPIKTGVFLAILIFGIQKTEAKAQTVDLSEQFESTVPIQRGATCSIYSSVQIMEAACFRRTHKHIKLSNEYLIYKVIEEKLRVNPNLDLSQIEFDPSILVSLDVDVTMPELVLNNFLEHDILTDNEFPNPEGFFGLFANLRNKTEVKTPSDFITKLDKFVRDENVEAIDQDLDQCLEKPAFVGFDDSAHATSKRALELLKSKTPFICTSHHFIGLNGMDTYHAAVISGYRHKLNFPDNIEFEVRDSLTGTAHWGAGLGSAVRKTVAGCDGGFTYISDTPTL